MKERLSSLQSRKSSALVIVLLSVVLLTIVIVALLAATSLQSSMSRQDFQGQASRTLAVTGLNSAITQIRTALGPWDNPYTNFCSPNGAPPTFFWSMSPGLITRWSYTSTTPSGKYPLFSQSTYGDTAQVNLNAPTSDGANPIIGGASAPALPVYWANVLQNPTQAPASTNQIIGRYAFWVDDESAKINVNTADGTMKYQTNSLGLGTPSEVSLGALQQTGANISTTLATNIVYLARTTGFNSPQEILRASGATADLYTNNVFNITCTSRSPDLNIFGQPKMAMLPVLGTSLLDGVTPGTNMAVNAITLQPLKEIYPTPSQLPTYTVTEPFYNSTGQIPWPLTFRQSFGPYNSGDAFGTVGPNDCAYLYKIPNYAYGNGQILAHYLAGTNSMGQPITWPTFSGTAAPAAGFAGKYTPRQIDSIVAQIVSLGAKDISPDIFYVTDPNGQGANLMPQRGYRTITAPFMFTGWLSNQFVTGLGRTPKVDSLLVKYTTFGSVNHVGDQDYQPPRTLMDIWLEWWLPAAFQGGRSVIPLTDFNAQVSLGTTYTTGLNTADQCSYEGDYTQLWLSMYLAAHGNATIPPRQGYPNPQYNWYPASIPKADYISPNYWSDQLLTNNQGMDIQGSPNNLNDPDQTKALQYHDPYAWTNLGGTGLPAPYPYPGSYPPYQGTNGTYAGTGGAWSSVFDTPFYLGELQAQDVAQDWAPGELRCLRSAFGSESYLDMKTNADGSVLNMGGGMQVRTAFEGGFSSELDPVPLDTFRGNTFGPTAVDPNTLTPTAFGDNGGAMGYHFDGEPWSTNAGLRSDPTWTVRDLNIAAVIPAGASIPIPGNSTGSSAGNTEWVLSRVADPLVNKFPGDWTNTTSDAPPTTTMGYSTASPPNVVWGWSPTTFTSYDEYSSGYHAKLADPDSYWMPQADCAISYPSDLATQTLIPRSARMPNIGYLQYLRTGIIPDDEITTSYKVQHGTPFRLVSYAPSTETASQETTRAANAVMGPASQPYPDWAMLDLLYVPSLLAPYGGPYGYYDTNSPPVWQGYGNPGTLANYSTRGGSTPGRVNPNGSVIYSTNTTIPVPGVSRLLPMEAVLQGLMVNQSLNTQVATGASSFDTTSPSFNPNPGWGGGSSVDAPTLTQAIYTYLTNNGPLRMPAELCNVPEIAALRPNGVNTTANNPTRNDLMRQIVGALTTQSNVFSVWTVGQTLRKSPANNANYGIFESGDTVLAETRLHFVVERYLDPGADGIYGNASNPGPDGIAGTYDDPVDSVNHPYCPHYLYRVIAAEEIR